MLDAYSMKFDGNLLRRGFWLYIWRITDKASDHLYVGRTGDSSSPYASSPFKRIGQDLDPNPNAKGNALGKQLRRAGVICEDCLFEMVAVGPIFDEQETFQQHKQFRDATAALERAVADWLRERGYNVLGTHPRTGPLDKERLRAVIDHIEAKFPALDTRALATARTATRLSAGHERHPSARSGLGSRVIKSVRAWTASLPSNSTAWTASVMGISTS